MFGKIYTLIAVAFGGLAIMCTSNLAFAKQGLTADEIVIGQSAAFTGTVSNEVKQATAGAQVYFDNVNKNGGVFGRKITLESLDDGFDPQRTVENTQKLISEEDAFALFLYRGTPTTEAILPLLSKSKIPLVGPVTGATSLHDPMQRYLFNVRATYREEVVAIARQMGSMGLSKIAVLVSNDTFGKDALAGLDASKKEGKLAEVTVATYERNTVAVEDAVGKIFAAKPQAVLMICTAKPCDAFVRAYRKAGGFQPIFALSNVSSPTFIHGLGDLSRGLGISQVFPNPQNTTIPISKEFQNAVKGKADLVSSYAAFEGYIAAKVLVEGLRKAGRGVTREGLVKALESMEQYDVGGLNLHYGPDSRNGLDFVELTVIGKDGGVLH
jgi:ABC-type branched-subunit amino acid transport system substrate-binding protein